MTDVVLTNNGKDTIERAIEAGGGGTTGIQVVDVQLNDAQIRGLPSTPHELIPAPGEGLLIQPISGYALMSRTVAWTNPGDPVEWKLALSKAGFKVQASLDIGIGGLIDGVIGTPPELAASPIAIPYFALNVGSGGLETARISLAALDNSSLVLYDDDNDGGSDYTDGDPANTLSLRIWYSIVPAVPFGAA